jgi:hypothetical protein
MCRNARIELAAVAVVLGLAWACCGDIISNTRLQIDLGNAQDAQAKAIWGAEPNRLSISEQGLGWSGDSDASLDGWLETKPLAVGTSWRPTPSLGITVEIQPGPSLVRSANGQVFTPNSGSVFVRHSPDLRNWSSWQVLRWEAKPQDPNVQGGRIFHGPIYVPQRDRSEYYRWLAEYAKTDVRWTDDEDAAVRWIVSREPDFLRRHFPFIGYVQFLYEASFHGGQRVKSFKANIVWTISGLHQSPTDPNEFNRRFSIPWRFEAK